MRLECIKYMLCYPLFGFDLPNSLEFRELVVKTDRGRTMVVSTSSAINCTRAVKVQWQGGGRAAQLER